MQSPQRQIDHGDMDKRLGCIVIACVIIARHDDHLPLYRQGEIYARSGVAISRSTLARLGGRRKGYIRAYASGVHELHKAVVYQIRHSRSGQHVSESLRHEPQTPCLAGGTVRLGRFTAAVEWPPGG